MTRQLVVAVAVMDLSEEPAKQLTESMLRTIWLKKLDDESFISGEDEILLDVFIAKREFPEEADNADQAQDL